MARSHGKIKCSIWTDEDFLDLAASEQRTYFMLLSQPRLSLVGAMDYKPNHWVGLASDLTIEAVEGSVAALEDAGFVCVDLTTEELLVRSMTKHDGLRGNPKLTKGFWAAWEAIASRALRKVAVDNMPSEAFDWPACPDPAKRLRAMPVVPWQKRERSIGPAISPSIEEPIGPAMHCPIAPPSAIRYPTTDNRRSDDRSTSPVDKHSAEQIQTNVYEIRSLKDQLDRGGESA